MGTARNGSGLGSFRLLDPATVTPLGHERAVAFDFWRRAAQWGDPSSSASMDATHPYDFVLDMRWDHSVVDFSPCFLNGNALEMVRLAV
jgi:hypothetical protein